MIIKSLLTSTEKMTRTVRHYLVSVLSIFAFCSCSEHIQPYPSDWPVPPTMSKDCGEITGDYLEGRPKDPGAAPPGVWAFMFPHAEVRLDDRTVKSRTISLYFDSQQTLHVDYVIDGKPASTKVFPPSEYVCKRSGLELRVHNRTSKGVYGQLPNFGTITNKAELFRVNDFLYAKSAWDTWGLIFYFIPTTSYSEWWSRFASQST